MDILKDWISLKTLSKPRETDFGIYEDARKIR